MAVFFWLINTLGDYEVLKVQSNLKINKDFSTKRYFCDNTHPPVLIKTAHLKIFKSGTKLIILSKTVHCSLMPFSATTTLNLTLIRFTYQRVYSLETGEFPNKQQTLACVCQPCITKRTVTYCKSWAGAAPVFHLGGAAVTSHFTSLLLKFHILCRCRSSYGFSILNTIDAQGSPLLIGPFLLAEPG